MPILVSHHNKVLEEIIEEVDKKRDWFKKATGGQLDSSLYADGVVACCNDLKSLLHQKLIK